VHICFDEEKKIDQIYENALSNSFEYRKWYTEQLPRKYATGQPQRYCGTTLGQISTIEEFYSTLLSVAKNADEACVIVDGNPQVVVEANLHAITCLQSYEANKHIKQPILSWLRNSIKDAFDKNALRVLCVDLDIEYEDLEDETLTLTIINLVNHFHHRGTLNELLEYCNKKRPAKFCPPLNFNNSNAANFYTGS
jgi:hypothetical protein